MTFEEWAKDKGYRFNEGDLNHCKSWARAAWEAALETAAKICDAKQEWYEEDRCVGQATAVGACADEIRELKSQ